MIVTAFIYPLLGIESTIVDVAVSPDYGKSRQEVYIVLGQDNLLHPTGIPRLQAHFRTPIADESGYVLGPEGVSRRCRSPAFLRSCRRGFYLLSGQTQLIELLK